MKTGTKGIELIKKFEGFKSCPYICPAGVPTIGYGTTRYPNSKKVSMKDACITSAQATTYLMHDLHVYEKQVDSLCRDDINQNQCDALISFAYNLGANSLKNSTLLKKVNKNPNDKTIRAEFLKWVYANGNKLQGLVKRRTEEADLYFS